MRIFVRRINFLEVFSMSQYTEIYLDDEEIVFERDLKNKVTGFKLKKDEKKLYRKIR